MSDYERVAAVIRYVAEHFREQPSLDSLAERAELSVSHFHRLFRRWAATTPKDFVRHLTHLEANRLLRSGVNVLDASLDSGLSGPGRLHDLRVKLEAASPGGIRSGGKGWEIRAGVAETPFGSAFLALSPRGICHLSFIPDDGDRDEVWEELRSAWPNATVLRDTAAVEEVAIQVFSWRDDARASEPIRVYARGTPFQCLVWRALVKIPVGEARSYGQIARVVDCPRGSRAVGSAVGANPISFLIPCHRVIQASGRVGNYRWGPVRKKAILAWERTPRIDSGV